MHLKKTISKLKNLSNLDVVRNWSAATCYVRKLYFLTTSFKLLDIFYFLLLKHGANEFSVRPNLSNGIEKQIRVQRPVNRSVFEWDRFLASSVSSDFNSLCLEHLPDRCSKSSVLEETVLKIPLQSALRAKERALCCIAAC